MARIRWSPSEVQALYDGVERYGVGQWGQMKRDAQLKHELRRRSNVDLKDKWRNLLKQPDHAERARALQDSGLSASPAIPAVRTGHASVTTPSPMETTASGRRAAGLDSQLRPAVASMDELMPPLMHDEVRAEEARELAKAQQAPPSASSSSKRESAPAPRPPSPSEHRRTSKSIPLATVQLRCRGYTRYSGRVEVGDCGLRLIRVPQNKHDENCTQVRSAEGAMLGLLAAEHARHLAPLLDSLKVRHVEGRVLAIEPYTREFSWLATLYGRRLPKAGSHGRRALGQLPDLQLLVAETGAEGGAGDAAERRPSAPRHAGSRRDSEVERAIRKRKKRLRKQAVPSTQPTRGRLPLRKAAPKRQARPPWSLGGTASSVPRSSHVEDLARARAVLLKYGYKYEDLRDLRGAIEVD
jgi:hypothetical protein